MDTDGLCFDIGLGACQTNHLLKGIVDASLLESRFLICFYSRGLHLLEVNSFSDMFYWAKYLGPLLIMKLINN